MVNFDKLTANWRASMGYPWAALFSSHALSTALPMLDRNLSLAAKIQMERASCRPNRISMQMAY